MCFTKPTTIHIHNTSCILSVAQKRFSKTTMQTAHHPVHPSSVWLFNVQIRRILSCSANVLLVFSTFMLLSAVVVSVHWNVRLVSNFKMKETHPLFCSLPTFFGFVSNQPHFYRNQEGTISFILLYVWVHSKPIKTIKPKRSFWSFGFVRRCFSSVFFILLFLFLFELFMFFFGGQEVMLFTAHNYRHQPIVGVSQTLAEGYNFFYFSDAMGKRVYCSTLILQLTL